MFCFLSFLSSFLLLLCFFFFFNDTATTEIYTLSLHDALPISPYGISKLAGEEYVAGWNRLFGSRHVSLRLANVYGPRQEASLEGGVIAIFLERLAAGKETTIFGDGEQTRDFIYVGDVVRGVLAAADHAGGIYNIGTGIETSVNELHAVCRRVTGIDRAPEYAEARPGDIERSVTDPALEIGRAH